MSEGALAADVRRYADDLDGLRAELLGESSLHEGLQLRPELGGEEGRPAERLSAAINNWQCDSAMRCLRRRR